MPKRRMEHSRDCGLGDLWLGMNDLPAANRGFAFAKCRGIQGGIDAQHDKIAIHPFLQPCWNELISQAEDAQIERSMRANRLGNRIALAYCFIRLFCLDGSSRLHGRVLP